MAISSICPNCGTEARSNYCSQCGQKQAEHRITVRHLIREVLDEQLGLNNRTVRTLKQLMLPGRLTTEYFAGRIQQYIQPFKLYLISSLLFFFVVAVAPDFQLIQIGAVSSTDSDSISATVTQPPEDFSVWVPPGSDNWLRDIRIDMGSRMLSRAAERNLHELSLFGVQEGTNRLIRTIEAQIPTVFFLLLPFYALLLYIFFRKQRPYYVEHFVFALHLHSFAFILLIPAVLVPVSWIQISTFLIVVLYFFLALKYVYGQGWLVTGVKYVSLWLLYLFYFAGGMMIAALVALTT